ncbi:MAG TPA: helix-turn-helix domain-containing protein [Acidimicrobiales bacterium]|jgi:transposase|nr:helix-turn-helix domain-containing protein [Acidimicrobiales bacterium]
MAEVIDVPLGLRDFDVAASELVDDVLEVTVVSTFPSACRHCGSTAVRGHGWHDRRIRDVAVGRPTVLMWRQGRLRCDDCGRTSRERHPEVPERRRITRRFERHLFERARKQPFAEVAAHERVSHWRVVDVGLRTVPRGRRRLVDEGGVLSDLRSPSRAEGQQRLEVWEHNLKAAGLTELTNAWRNLNGWRDEILAYFDDRETNAFAEGTTKIKVMK